MEHNMILSASGWRKIFAASGDEQDKNPEITETDRSIAVIAADVFFDYIRKQSGQETPVIALGIDARPTGPALADAMIHALIKKGAIIQYSAVTSAPEIMAYAKKLDGFIYISASHNPVGHNGIKFGINDGGVLNAQENAKLTADFVKRLSDDKGVEEAVKKACQPSAPESGEKKKKGIYGAIAVCAFAAALCVGVGVCFALTNHGNDSISVPVSYEPVVTEPSEPAELNVEQVDIVSASKKGDSFIVSFDSDEEEPFVVVFSDDESEKNSVSGTRQYYYAYMNEGYGEQEIKNAAAGSGVVNKDMFRIEGYLKGEAVGNDFVPEIIVNTDYEEVPFEDSALVTVVINMDLGQKKNGRLFYSVDLADYSFSYNSYVQSACVVDGKTEQQVVAINVPPGTTDSSVYVGVDVLYFVESDWETNLPSVSTVILIWWSHPVAPNCPR